MVAENMVMSKKNYLLSLILALFLIFNLGMVYQSHYAEELSQVNAFNNVASNSCSELYDPYIHVAFFGKYAYRNMKIIRGIARTFHTILEHTSSPIYLHVLLDFNSKQRTARTLKGVSRTFKRRLNVSLNVYSILLFMHLTYAQLKCIFNRNSF